MYADRVLEETTTTGTGAITPSGAVTGYQSFSSAFSADDTFDYVIFGVDEFGVPSGEWESGVGTWTGTTITRDSVSASSNSGSAVDFSAGTKNVMVSVNSATLDTITETTSFKGARVYRTADFTSASGSPAAIAFTSEVYDYGSWHDNTTNNSRFTVPAGVDRVRILAQVDLTTPASYSLSVRKNGVSSAVATEQVGASGYTYTVAGVDTGVLECVEGDYYEIYLETSTTVTVRNGRSWASIEAVSNKITVSDLLSSVTNQTSTSRTLQASDNNSILEMENASANEVIIPASASVGIAVGTILSVVQTGSGATSISAAAGVTLNGVSEGSTTISGQWSGVSLYKRATDAWVVQGAHGGVS